jgi:serine/threonine-protein kinase
LASQELDVFLTLSVAAVIISVTYEQGAQTMGDETTKLMGDYEIMELLGAGGMGRVYRVRNVITDRVEAMKVLLPDLEGQEEVAARFLREIKVLAGISHPNIAALHTALTINNQLVMIMEYVEGCSISSRLSQGSIPAHDAFTYMDQVLAALAYAHERHIIHRDIKPANMMLTPSGTVKLMDFGIARTDGEPSKLTATGTTLGSVNYMSPEQVKGAGTDERSDLYSVGISLYEMVTGEKPFHGDSNFSIMSAHIQQTPRPPVELHPGLPAGLNEVILTSIAKAPEQRFQSAEAFRNALKSVQGSATPTQVPLPAYNPATVPTAPRTAQVTAPKVPTAVPQSLPVIPAQQPAASGHRGLYMTLGALIVLAVLAAAAIYIPKRGQTSAATGTAPVTTSPSTQAPVIQQPVTPAAKPAEEVKAAVDDQKQVADNRPPMVPVKKMASQSGGGAPSVPDNSKAEAAAKAAALDALEHEIDQLSSRAAAVNNSLENLQRQQAASGFGLRGDMASKQSSMKNNLAKAQDAIEHNDLERAKRYSSLAESDVEALEKFLGR